METEKQELLRGQEMNQDSLEISDDLIHENFYKIILLNFTHPSFK